VTGAKRLGVGAVLAAVLLAPMTARADYVGWIEAEFVRVRPATSVRVSTLGGVYVTAGIYHWTKTNPDDGPFWAFCIEPTIWLDTSETRFDVHTLHQVVGQTASDHVEELWVQKVDQLDPYPGPYPTWEQKKKAAAFQVAVWEFVHEDYSNGYDLGSGDFRASNSSAVGLAQDWIDDVVTALDNGGSGSALLYAMVNDNTQNQAVLGSEFQVVPLPAAVWGGMVLLGAMGGIAGLRRRLRRG